MVDSLNPLASQMLGVQPVEKFNQLYELCKIFESKQRQAKDQTLAPNFSYEELMQIARAAAAKGHSPAVLWLAEKYAFGVPALNFTADPTSAVKILEEGVRRRIIPVMIDYGKAQLGWESPLAFVPKNIDAGIRILQDSAAAGDAEAHYLLSDVYVGITDEFKEYKNEKKSLEHLSKAIEKGYAPAEIERAYRYESGTRGSEKNIGEAFRIYRKYADQRYYLQRLNLARLLIDYVIYDPRTTLADYKALKNEAFDNLDRLRGLVKGVGFSKVQKATYYRLLGTCYLRGIGVEAN